MPITGGIQAALGSGTKVQMDVGPYVAAGASATFRALGFIDGDTELNEAVEWGKIEPSNMLGALASWIKKRSIEVGGAILGMDLENLAILRGGVPADLLVASGVATLPVKDYLGNNAWQVRLTIPDLSVKPGYTGFPTDVYTKLIATYWMGKFGLAGAIPFSVQNPFKLKYSCHFLQDLSVTASTSTDQWGKWALSVA